MAEENGPQLVAKPVEKPLALMYVPLASGLVLHA